MPQSSPRRSTIVAIGDELCLGFTLDTNSHWLAGRLRLAGFPLKRVTATRDRQEEIVEQLGRDLGDAEVTDVFCSGGLGPTPDDRTFAAVAAFLGRELTYWPATRERIERRVRLMHQAGLLDSAEPTEGNLRMALIPAGPEHVFRNRRGMAPGLHYLVGEKRLFILPGVPLELKGIVTEELEPLFLRGHTGATVRELRFQFTAESRFYPLMREIERSHPDVSVGSYPNSESKELTLRCLGDDPARVEAALAALRRLAEAQGMTPTA